MVGGRIRTIAMCKGETEKDYYETTMADVYHDSWLPWLITRSSKWMQMEALPQWTYLLYASWFLNNYHLIKDRFANPTPVNVIHQPERTITRHSRKTEPTWNYSVHHVDLVTAWGRHGIRPVNLYSQRNLSGVSSFPFNLFPSSCSNAREPWSVIQTNVVWSCWE